MHLTRHAAVTVLVLLLVSIAGVYTLLNRPASAGGSQDRPVTRASAPATRPVTSSTTTTSVVPGARPSASRADATPDSPSPSPDSVVVSYYRAVNDGDYATAWRLGGTNLSSSYEEFVDGYRTTSDVDLEVVDVDGDTVRVRMEAHRSDGTSATFAGVYRVRGGLIHSASVNETG